MGNRQVTSGWLQQKGLRFNDERWNNIVTAKAMSHSCTSCTFHAKHSQTAEEERQRVFDKVTLRTWSKAPVLWVKLHNLISAVWLSLIWQLVLEVMRCSKPICASERLAVMGKVMGEGGTNTKAELGTCYTQNVKIYELVNWRGVLKQLYMVIHLNFEILKWLQIIIMTGNCHCFS